MQIYYYKMYNIVQGLKQDESPENWDESLKQLYKLKKQHLNTKKDTATSQQRSIHENQAKKLRGI